VPQAAYMQETLYDELADRLGIDRLEFRLKNALRNGQPTVCGHVMEEGIGISACLEALQPHWDRALAEADGTIAAMASCAAASASPPAGMAAAIPAFPTPRP
jgi:aldehyde oxidoreductase